MKNYILLIAMSFAIAFQGKAQQFEAQDEQRDTSAISKPFELTFMGDNDAAMNAPDDFQSNIYFKAIEEHPQSNEQLERRIEKTKLKILAAGIDPQTALAIEKNKRALTPVFVSGFTGNSTSGTPPDNSVAVNSKGQVIHILNSTIAFYSPTGTLIPGTSKSLVSFFKGSLVAGQSTTMSTTQCDPKVLFDCEKKRFIAFSMTCVPGDVNSRILVAFSKTEDPTQGWWVYNFKSDVYGLDIWFDHPRVGINEFDYFVSGNMFDNQTNTYYQSHIFQINKSEGYAGSTAIKAVAHANLAGNPFTPTIVRPGHCATTGNVMYSLSTISSSSTSNAFRLHKIVGKAADLPALPTIASSTIITPIVYTSGGYALQPNTVVTLKVGDIRGQDAFLLNDVMHFVFHFDAGSGYHGLHYNRIVKDGTGNFKTCTSKKISKPNTDYAYASMFNFANDSIGGTSQNTIIGFLESSATVAPGMRALTVDDNMNVSGILKIKDGLANVNYQNVGANDTTNTGIVTTRWGDYTGLWRQIVSGTPTVFFAGHYGSTANKWINYVAKLKPYIDYPTIIEATEYVNDAKIYPNPSNNGYWFLQILWNKHEVATFDLYDMLGKKVTTLYKGDLNNGENRFNFNTNSLSKGTYFVKVFTNNAIITQQKLIIQ